MHPFRRGLAALLCASLLGGAKAPLYAVSLGGSIATPSKSEDDAVESLSRAQRGKTEAGAIFGVTRDLIFDIANSANDTMKWFSLPHYKNAYYLTLALLRSLDEEPLGGRQTAKGSPDNNT